MTTQNAREIENTARIALAQATATELGEGWTFEENEHGWGGTLIGPNREHIECSGGWGEDGRLVLAAEWPTTSRVDSEHPVAEMAWNRADYRDSGRDKITVSLTRTPKAVASEIRRRLLPEYVERLPLRLEQTERHLARYAEAAAFRSEIAEILAPHGVRTQYVGKLSTYDRKGERPTTEWEISGSLDYLKVEMSSLKPEQMRAIARLVATF